MLDWLRTRLTKRRMRPADEARRVRMEEEPPSDRFVLVIALMIVFFAGLVALEVVHMLILGTWSDVVFNGVMLVVGTIVGAIWGQREG